MIIVCCLILEVLCGKTGIVESSLYDCLKIYCIFLNYLVYLKLSSVKEAKWCIFKEGGKTILLEVLSSKSSTSLTLRTWCLNCNLMLQLWWKLCKLLPSFRSEVRM